MHSGNWYSCLPKPEALTATARGPVSVFGCFVNVKYVDILGFVALVLAKIRVCQQYVWGFDPFLYHLLLRTSLTPSLYRIFCQETGMHRLPVILAFWSHLATLTVEAQKLETQ